MRGDENMNIYAFSSLLASYVCFLLGILVYQKDPKNQLNKMFMLLCVSLGYVAFTEFGYRQSVDFDTAFLWLKLDSFWPFVLSFFVHFVLIFTKRSHVFRSKIAYFILYAPALVFFVLDVTTTLVSGEPVKEYWGWTYSVPENSLVYNISSIWGFSLAVLSAIVCFMYFYKLKDDTKRQRAKHVFIGVSIPVVVGSVTDGIFPIVGVKVPELSAPTVTIGVIFIVYGMWKYRLFELTPAAVAENIVAAMSNALFLVKNDGTISLVNQSALRLLGYDEHELLGQPIHRIFAAPEWEPQRRPLITGLVSEETTFVSKDGSVIPVLLSLSVVYREDGSELGMVCVASDLTDRKEAEEARKKELLLKEIHHRVKNNMQIISSLLRLQSRYTEDEKHKEMLKESQNRIKSMALIHEKLYQSRDVSQINVREYITDMVHTLIHSYGARTVTPTIEVDDIPLGVDAAVPCGLIINELVSNCLKHAFPDRKGEITIGLHAVDGDIELTVSDNGIGIPEDVDFRNTKTLGLRLVTMLAEDQLRGTLRLIRNGGTTFCVTFKMNQ